MTRAPSNSTQGGATSSPTGATSFRSLSLLVFSCACTFPARRAALLFFRASRRPPEHRGAVAAPLLRSGGSRVSTTCRLARAFVGRLLSVVVAPHEGCPFLPQIDRRLRSQAAMCHYSRTTASPVAVAMLHLTLVVRATARNASAEIFATVGPCHRLPPDNTSLLSVHATC